MGSGGGPLPGNPETERPSSSSRAPGLELLTESYGKGSQVMDADSGAGLEATKVICGVCCGGQTALMSGFIRLTISEAVGNTTTPCPKK